MTSATVNRYALSCNVNTYQGVACCFVSQQLECGLVRAMRCWLEHVAGVGYARSPYQPVPCKPFTRPMHEPASTYLEKSGLLTRYPFRQWQQLGHRAACSPLTEEQPGPAWTCSPTSPSQSFTSPGSERKSQAHQARRKWSQGVIAADKPTEAAMIEATSADWGYEHRSADYRWRQWPRPPGRTGAWTCDTYPPAVAPDSHRCSASLHAAQLQDNSVTPLRVPPRYQASIHAPRLHLALKRAPHPTTPSNSSAALPLTWEQQTKDQPQTAPRTTARITTILNQFAIIHPSLL